MVDDLSIAAFDKTTSSQADTAAPHQTMIEIQTEDIDKAMPAHCQSIIALLLTSAAEFPHHEKAL